ncbi:peroxisomal membrane protein 4 [Fistulina hepatica ATCC 64428]|uniref:Peroxisomal membrane protein 4 n=1 Tax=Fistulina hepatica ATCC 64428 TaxID=1128425 RepID=A0A0D7AKP3_9AGAR|nr:peroxisomal membrane protein 4 [Fistulina hepatica ATCC 64428]
MSSAVQAYLANPAFHDYLAIIKGARSGFVYGCKVRFPHALIMSILFGRGDWPTRLRIIFRATKQHATSLAKFVALYKTLLLLQKKANGGKPRSADTFIAGLIGGYFVFGSRNAVNEQIVLYVLSRVVASFVPRAGPLAPSAPSRPIPPDPIYFSAMAAIAWASVMWLFEHRGHTIQPGMFNSMVYLYRDSEIWNDLRSLLWHNK